MYLYIDITTYNPPKNPISELIRGNFNTLQMCYPYPPIRKSCCWCQVKLLFNLLETRGGCWIDHILALCIAYYRHLLGFLACSNNYEYRTVVLYSTSSIAWSLIHQWYVNIHLRIAGLVLYSHISTPIKSISSISTCNELTVAHTSLSHKWKFSLTTRAQNRSRWAASSQSQNALLSTRPPPRPPHPSTRVATTPCSPTNASAHTTTTANATASTLCATTLSSRALHRLVHSPFDVLSFFRISIMTIKILPSHQIQIFQISIYVILWNSKSVREFSEVAGHGGLLLL